MSAPKEKPRHAGQGFGVNHFEAIHMGNTTAVPSGAQQLVRVFDGFIGGEPAQVCDGRELHAFLKAGWQFSDWIKKRIEQYGFELNQDFTCVSVKAETHRKDGQRGITKVTEYHLTLDMAKELSMVENNEQGRMARRYFIEMERRAQAQPRLPSDEPVIEQRGFRGCSILLARYGEQLWLGAGSLSTALGLGSSDRIVRSLPAHHKRKQQRGTRALWMIDLIGAERAAEYCKPELAAEYRGWLQRITMPSVQQLPGFAVERFGLEQLLNMRLLVSFDETGGYHAKPIDPGALLVKPSRLADVLNDPFTVPMEYLPGILQVVAGRMSAAIRPALPAS